MHARVCCSSVCGVMHTLRFCFTVVALATRYGFSPGTDNGTSVTAVRPSSSDRLIHDSSRDFCALGGPVKGNNSTHHGFWNASLITPSAPVFSPDRANATPGEPPPWASIPPWPNRTLERHGLESLSFSAISAVRCNSAMVNVFHTNAASNHHHSDHDPSLHSFYRRLYQEMVLWIAFGGSGWDAAMSIICILFST